MSEQVAKGYAAALGMPYRPNLSANSKGGKHISDEQIEVKSSALMEQHGRRSGREDLGDAGQIVDGHGSYGRRFRVIGEAANAIQSQDFAVERDAEGSAGKSAVGNGGFEHGISRREALSLV